MLTRFSVSRYMHDVVRHYTKDQAARTGRRGFSLAKAMDHEHAQLGNSAVLGQPI
jgi:hypothetical protein